MRKSKRANNLATRIERAHAVGMQAKMIRCPFCSADLDRSAVVCRNCKARRGFEMFGPTPEAPAAAWIKGLILPAVAIAASIAGHLLNPSPVWFAAAGFALFVAMLGVRRLIEGSRWFHL